MAIFFLRHGQSMGNAWYGAYENDATNFLTVRGVKQAELAAYTIQDVLGDKKIDRVISSDMTRARQTAVTVMQTLGDWKRDYETSETLNEWCWNGRGKEWYKDEDIHDAKARYEQAYREFVLPVASNENVLIVSHYYTMKSLFNIIKFDGRLDSPVTHFDPFEHAGIPNAIPFYGAGLLDDDPIALMPGHKDVTR